MKNQILAVAALLFGAGCVGIIDNEGIGSDAGTTAVSRGGQGGATGSGAGTVVTTPGSGGSGTTPDGGGSGGGAVGTIGAGATSDAAGKGDTTPIEAGTDGGVVGATFTQVQAIIQRNCGSCHNTFSNYAIFTSHSTAQCGGDILAVAKNPAKSSFLELVLGQCSGFVMPSGCSAAPCISAAEIQTVTSWINAGALNN